jgi:hypothetical protein
MTVLLVQSWFKLATMHNKTPIVLAFPKCNIAKRIQDTLPRVCGNGHCRRDKKNMTEIGQFLQNTPHCVVFCFLLHYYTFGYPVQTNHKGLVTLSLETSEGRLKKSAGSAADHYEFK